MKNVLMILASAFLLLSCNDKKGAEQPSGSGAAISIDAAEMGFLAKGDVVGENTVTVTSSGEWRLAGQKTWCRPSLTEGKDGDKVEFIADKNTSGESRSVTYTFFSGDKAAKLLVTQIGNDYIDISQDRFVIGPDGSEDIRIRVVSSLPFTTTVDAAGQGWIITPDGMEDNDNTFRYLHYRIAANDTYKSRMGAIVLSIGKAGEDRSIEISQGQNDAIQPEKVLYKQSLEASQVKMTVWSNVPFGVEIPMDATWITLQSQPGDMEEWSSQELVFDLTATDQYRMGGVTLKAKDGSISVPVTIQQGEPVTFAVPDQNFLDYLLTEKQYIMSAGTEGMYLLTAAGGAATAIDTYTTLWQKKGCESLEGIQYFTNLTTLNCSYNRLRELDLSKNTKLSDVSKCVPNGLGTLRVGPAVTTVNFSGKLYDYNTKNSSWGYDFWTTSMTIAGTGITSIDISNNRVRTLDVSGCPALTTLKGTMAGGYPLGTIYMSEDQRGKVTVTASPAPTIIYK